MKLTTQNGQSDGAASQRERKALESPTALVATICSDSTALEALTRAVSHKMYSPSFAKDLLGIIESVVAQRIADGPGRLIAGTVYNDPSAITYPNGTNCCVAYVNLSGAATSVACYVPPHLEADVTPGCEVWVTPCNGLKADLMIVAVRAFVIPPAGRATWLTSLSTVWTAQAIAAGASVNTTVAGSFGIPAQASAVCLIVQYTSTVAGAFVTLAHGTGASDTNFQLIAGNVQVANQTVRMQGWLPLDSSGAISAFADGGQAGTLTVYTVGYMA